MTNGVVNHQYGLQELEQLAYHVAQSGLFGVATVEQALTLMAIAQAEGRHPAAAARDYDIITTVDKQGHKLTRPAKKAEALYRDFLQAGGKVEWHRLDDEIADATFSHEQGGSVRIAWDMERARKAGLAEKQNWSRYRRQMLRSRCVAEGARTVCPMATSGLPTSDELRDELPEKDVTPESGAAILPPPPPPVTLQSVLEAYDQAKDVPAFQRARALAAKLPEADKQKAREKDAATLKRLKGGDAPEPARSQRAKNGRVDGHSRDVAAAGSQQSEGPPLLTQAKLFDLMRSRRDIDLLDADATLIDQLPADQHVETAAEYHRLRAKLLTELRT